MKMNIEDVMKLNCTEEEQSETLNKILRTIKPFDRYSMDEDVPVDLLEKYIDKMNNKYAVRINYILYNYINTPRYWTLCLLETTGKSYLDTLHGLHLSEVMIKAVIRLHYAAKHKEIKIRS